MKEKNDLFVYYYSTPVLKEDINFEKRIKIFLSMYIFLSGFVFVEPSPAEVLFLIFFISSIKSVKIDKEIFLISTLLFFPCFISTYIGQTFFYSFNSRFFLIDIYLFFLFIITSSYFKKVSDPDKMLSDLMLSWALAGLINILAGIVSISKGGKLFGADILVYGLRLKGFFKDPNVLGPFLVPPAVFFLYKTVKAKTKVLRSFLTFIVLSFGVVFTFSRAAWLNYSISIFGLILTKLFKPKELKRLILVILIIVVIALFFWKLSYSIELLGFNLQTFFIGRTGLKSYDQDRFAAQMEFIDIISSTSLLFGAGPGNYEIFAGMSTHSLYLRYIGERGLIGFTLFSIFFLVLFVRSAKSRLFDLLFPFIIGQLVNSLFVDSLHWRHLWILLSLVFIKDRNYT